MRNVTGPWEEAADIPTDTKQKSLSREGGQGRPLEHCRRLLKTRDLDASRIAFRRGTWNVALTRTHPHSPENAFNCAIRTQKQTNDAAAAEASLFFVNFAHRSAFLTHTPCRFSCFDTLKKCSRSRDPRQRAARSRPATDDTNNGRVAGIYFNRES